jgi:hypothetical protein
MRNRDPHDDPLRRRRESYQGPPVTLGHIRSHGVRGLLIYCSTGLCHHSARIIGRNNKAVLSTSLAVFVLGAMDAAAACIVAVDYSARREFGRKIAQ